MNGWTDGAPKLVSRAVIEWGQKTPAGSTAVVCVAYPIFGYRRSTNSSFAKSITSASFLLSIKFSTDSKSSVVSYSMREHYTCCPEPALVAAGRCEHHPQPQSKKSKYGVQGR